MASQIDHETLVVSQFGSRAAAYVTSSVHAQGEDLRDIAALVAGHAHARVLDLGCGGGHVSFAVAPHVANIVAYDLSEEMLSAVTAEAVSRGFDNLSTARGTAESLPFEDASFDFVFTRFSAHHWYDVKAGLAEARRVLKPGGTAAFMDVVAPAGAPLDTFLQTIEMLRDPSHVRDYTAEQWLAFVDESGFAVTNVTQRRLHLEFAAWIARMQTPPLLVDAVRDLQLRASAPVAAHFELKPDGSFTIDTIAIEAEPRSTS